MSFPPTTKRVIPPRGPSAPFAGEEQVALHIAPPTGGSAAAAAPSAAQPLAPELAPGTLLDGRFELLGRIATGGMAEIFLARENASDIASRKLVVKKVHRRVAQNEEFQRMFLDEARVAMSLSHAHICHIYAFGKHDHSYFIAMEYVDGVTLSHLLNRARMAEGVPLPIALKIIAAVADALHYAHRARDDEGRPLGIVHRDVSPQNVMVGFDGSVKLLDFGIAKVRSPSGHTDEGVVKGKFAYMSPEQCLRQSTDPRSDIFALGVVLFEAVTARRLYQRATEFDTMRAIIDGPVPSVRALDPLCPEALEFILQTALAKEPAERFQSAAELRDAIEMFLAAMRSVVTPSTIATFLDGIYPPNLRSNAAVTATGRPPAMLPEPSSEAPSAASYHRRKAPARRARAALAPRWIVVTVALVLIALGIAVGYLLRA